MFIFTFGGILTIKNNYVMSKENENKDLQIVDANDVNPMVAVASALEKLDDAENTGLNLVKSNLEMTKGEVKRFAVIGKGIMPTDKGSVNTIELIDSDKQIHYTASAVINNALGSANIGTGVELTYMGEEKLTGGKKLKRYSVELLNL